MDEAGCVLLAASAGWGNDEGMMGGMGPELGSVLCSAVPRRAEGSTGAVLPTLPLASECVGKPRAKPFRCLGSGGLEGERSAFRVCVEGKKNRDSETVVRQIV